MKLIRNVFLFGALVAVPALGMAQTPASTPAPAPAAKSATAAKPAANETAAKDPAVHAVKGVIKSVDANSLVITGSGAKAKERNFVLNSATVKTGTPVVGASVQVRYKTEGKQNIATAVTVSTSAKK
jgi:hypothetical protein